jgi:CBS domain-containing protein
MSPEVVVCRATDRVEDISNFIRDRGLKNIPVVDDRGRPIGLLTARDILRALLLDAQYDAAQLIDYVKGVGYR